MSWEAPDSVEELLEVHANPGEICPESARRPLHLATALWGDAAMDDASHHHLVHPFSERLRHAHRCRNQWLSLAGSASNRKRRTPLSERRTSLSATAW